MHLPTIHSLSVCFLALVSLTCSAQDTSAQDKEPKQTPDPWLELKGEKGPGKGKYIVFVTGDEEYRSEEGMPQLAKVLAKRHGFDCTVLFSIHKKTGEIDPRTVDNIPGLDKLAKADLMVIFTRFRDLPDEQMKHIADYVESGRPIIGLRTATHAFRASRKHKTYQKYTNSKEWPGGFGRQVLGEKWIDHHGAHGRESTRGIAAPGMKDHPILRGIEPKTIWDSADVYRVRLPMMKGVQTLVLGQVLSGMKPGDEPARATEGKPGKNNPMMPIAWLKTWEPGKDKKARVFATTLGSAPAFTQEGSRRLLVNACYWALGMEKQIPEKSDVALVGKYEPSNFGFGKHKSGVKPADLR